MSIKPDDDSRLEPGRPDAPATWQRMFAPVDIAFLAYFRVVLGATLCWQIGMYLVTADIETQYIAPVVHFTYHGFDWVRPWPGDGMVVHFLVLALLALMIVFGLCYRISMALFCLCYTYLFLIDKTLYQNHYYLICLLTFLMTFMPANRAWSLDARLSPSIRSSTTPAWTLWLLRMQIAMPYFFGGVAKLNPDWLRGEPIRQWLYSGVTFPMISDSLHNEVTVWALSYGGMLFDLIVVPLLLWRRTRLVAYLVSLCFHLTNAWLFKIGVFPWFMMVATLIFFEPDWPRRVLRLIGVGRSRVTEAQATTVPSTGRQKLIAAAVILYAAIQLLVPLRRFLYSGSASWTGRGDLFAWRMKLDDKSADRLGILQFNLSSPANNKTWVIVSGRYLHNLHQLYGMPRHPDMVLQFSHYLAERGRKRGYHDVQVRARANISLNGRKHQYMIDPTVDLVAVPRKLFGPRPWVVPLHEPLPAPMPPDQYAPPDPLKDVSEGWNPGYEEAD